MLDCISVENMRRSDAETINQFVPGLALNPVTRKPQNSKAYNRNKSRNWKRDYQRTNSGTLLFKYRFQIRQIVNDPVCNILS